MKKDLIKGIIIGVLITVTILYIPVHKARMVDAKINLITDILKDGYYEELSDEDISSIRDHLYSGLFSDLDRYTRYYTAKEYKEEKENTKRQFGGIGIKIKYSEEMHNIVVIHVLEGTPAYKEGIKIGDIIEEIDGISATSIELSQINQKLRGNIGSTLNLKIQRENQHLDFSLIREEINYPSTRCEIFDNVAYIKIYDFSDRTDEDVIDILDKLDTIGINDIIFDLRDNLGGLSESALNICSRMFPSGVLYYDVYRDGTKKANDFKSDLSSCNYNIYVMVNHESASCSEVFASFISENNYGKVIGETTYGKGVTQNFIELKDGTALQYTQSYWETEGGTNFLNIGLTPDIYCKNDFDDYTNFEIDRSNDKMLDFVLDLFEDSE